MGLGILGSSLGVNPSSPEAAELNKKYPWHVFSRDTLALQAVTNQSLQAAGYCPIPSTGILDGSLCGARNHLTVHSREFFGRDMLFDSPPACDDPAHASELSMPTAGCFKPAPIQLDKPIGAKLTRTQWLMIGGVASVLLAGYVAFKGPSAQRA